MANPGDADVQVDHLSKTRLEDGSQV